MSSDLVSTLATLNIAYHEVQMDRDRLRGLIEKHIHLNACSDEGGWFAFWLEDGKITPEFFDVRVNGCESEAQAIDDLMTSTLERLKELQTENARLTSTLTRSVEAALEKACEVKCVGCLNGAKLMERTGEHWWHQANSGPVYCDASSIRNLDPSAIIKAARKDT